MVIIKEKYGRLGNRLWQFSHLLAFGKEYNLSISYPGFNDYADYFEGTRNNLFCSHPMIYIPVKVPQTLRKLIFQLVPLLKRILMRINKYKKIYKHIWVQRGYYYDLDADKNKEVLKEYSIVTLEGWLTRGNISFANHKKFIRSYFTPNKKFTQPVDELISFIREKHEIIIGIHIRRGDLKNAKPDNYFTYKDYLELVKSISQLFNNKNISFIIGSDEKIPRKLFEEYKVYYTNGFLINDLYAFSKCDFIIGVASTFTMWASFWGDVPLCIIENLNQEINLDSFIICNH